MTSKFFGVIIKSLNFSKVKENDDAMTPNFIILLKTPSLLSTLSLSLFFHFNNFWRHWRHHSRYPL
jgi:hypothetical protein